MNRKNPLKTLIVLALGAAAVLALPTVAAAKDRNHDRIPDRWEKRHHLSLQVKQAHRDQDGDQLRNRAEFLAGDNPRDRDSDDDGVVDGEENAGTIQSFDPGTGRLTIALFGGETLSGLVGDETEIECGGDHSGTASASEDGEEQASPDDEGGEDESGDDTGDQGEEGESGDDSGGHEGEAPSCTTADLTEGATVKEAELRLENGVSTFGKVELAG